MLKAFDHIKRVIKSGFFFRGSPILLQTCAIVLSYHLNKSNKGTMIYIMNNHFSQTRVIYKNHCSNILYFVKNKFLHCAMQLTSEFESKWSLKRSEYICTNLNWKLSETETIWYGINIYVNCWDYILIFLVCSFFLLWCLSQTERN